MPKRNRKKGRKTVDQQFVKALAHELRVEILTILTERIASPNELAKELQEGLSQISYHVKVLKEYKRIELVRTEPRRGAVEHYYRSTSKTLLPAKAWRGIKGGLRTVIGGGLASDLFDDLADALTAENLTKADSHISRMPLVLDAEGQKNLEAIAQRVTDEVEDEQRASVARVAKAKDAVEVKGYTFGLLAFEVSRDLSGAAQRRKPGKAASANGKGARAKGRAGSNSSAGRKGRGKSRSGGRRKGKSVGE